MLPRTGPLGVVNREVAPGRLKPGFTTMTRIVDPRAFSHRWPVVSLVAVALFSATVGCSSESAEQSDDEAGVFTGTPDEYTELMMGCLEEHGIATQDEGANGFSFESSDEALEISQMCRESIGEPKIVGLSEDELRERYDARVEQWECLVDNELLSGNPITFETFVDEYERSGQTRLWEPTSEVHIDSSGPPVNPSGLCPKDSW